MSKQKITVKCENGKVVFDVTNYRKLKTISFGEMLKQCARKLIENELKERKNRGGTTNE